MKAESVVNASLRKHTNPIVFLFLRLPFGISMGVITVTLPFWLSEAGVSVTQIGFIEVVALSPITGRVLLALVMDLTWSPRTWFAVGAVVSALAVALLGLLPLRTTDLVWVTVIAFVYALAINCVAVPVGVLLARTVAEAQRGRAAGWYMAANLGGAGLGGGAGLWLGTHASRSYNCRLHCGTALHGCGARHRPQRPFRAPIAGALERAAPGRTGEVCATACVRMPSVQAR